MQLAHPTRPAAPTNRLVRLPEVERLCGIKKTTIYSLIGAGQFPKPIRLGTRMVAWSEAAVLAWVQARLAEAGAQEVQQ